VSARTGQWRRLADMSLPPALRGRRKAGRVGGTPTAQMSHAVSGKARKKRREGERKLAGEHRRGPAACAHEGAVAVGSAVLGVLAWLCPDCGTQLDPGFRSSELRPDASWPPVRRRVP